MKHERLSFPIPQLLIVTFLTVLLLLLLNAVIAQNTVTNWDQPFSQWAVTQSSSPVENFFRFITELGSYTVVRNAALVICAWLLYKRDWGRAVLLLILIAATVVIEPPMKEFVARPRPFFQENYLYGKEYSFPSGHSMLAAAFYTMTAYLGWVYAKHRWLKNTLLIISIGLIFLVGLSRVVLGFHFLTDVLGGWLIGVVLFLLLLLVYQWLVSRLSN